MAHACAQALGAFIYKYVTAVSCGLKLEAVVEEYKY